MPRQGELLASDTGPNPPAHRDAMKPATPEAAMLDDLNAAKALAWKHAAAAVEVLAKIMVDTELYDTEVRVQAAAELLQFAAKGPF